MNPLVASSLVSVGRDLLEKVTTPSNNLPQPTSESFAKELDEVSAVDKGLSRKELKQEFMQSPAVQSFLEKDNGDTLYLEKRADGSMQILSSTGRSLVLNPGSQACNTAKNFFESCLKEQSNLSDHRPNTVEIKV
jgi:hypothetical protein